MTQIIAPTLEKKALPWAVCFFKKIDEKYKGHEILFEECGAININELPFPKHQNISKVQVMMASHSKIEVEELQPEGEADLERWLKMWRACLSSNFYDQMDVSIE